MLVLPYSTLPRVTAARTLIKQVPHDPGKTGTQGRGQVACGICPPSIFSSWWTQQHIVFFPGALQLRLPINFPQAMSLLRDSKRYPTAGALCCYNNETKFGVKEATSLFKNHTHTRYNPREYFKFLDSLKKKKKENKCRFIRGVELRFIYFQTWQLIVEHFKIGAWVYSFLCSPSVF